MKELDQATVKKALEETIKSLLYVDLSSDDIGYHSKLGGGSDLDSTATELTKQINKAIRGPHYPQVAPSGSAGVVKITKEQYEAMKKMICEYGGEKPFTATKSLALDGLMQMSYCFGASSTEYITLYPSIG